VHFDRCDTQSGKRSIKYRAPMIGKTLNLVEDLDVKHRESRQAGPYVIPEFSLLIDKTRSWW
jgi:hypothetical protein